jgi:hypothetical protein
MKYLIFILSAFIISCTNHNGQKQVLIPDGQSEFAFPGYSGIRYSGLITNDGTELLYFANTEVSKRIDFFYTIGKPFCSVTLKPIISSGEHIESIFCVSLDTIMVKTAINGNVYLLNRKGIIWRRVECVNTWDNGFKIEPTATIANNNFYLNHKFIFHGMPEFPSDENLSMPARLNKQASLAGSQPYFLTIENWWNDSVKYKFSNPNFYSRFVDAGYINMEPPLYSCSDSNVLLFSIYSDKIYKMDRDNNKVEKEVKISSKYTSVGVKPIPVSTEHFGDPLNALAQTGGIIINVTFDKYRRLYYVSVRHTVSKKANLKERSNINWSIIVLDAHLNYKEEILMEAGKYNPGDIIVTENGIIIYKINDELLPKKIQFDVFRIKSS